MGRLTLHVRERSDGWEMTKRNDEGEQIGETIKKQSERGAFKEAMRMLARREICDIATEDGTVYARGLAEWFLRLYDED